MMKIGLYLFLWAVAACAAPSQIYAESLPSIWEGAERKWAAFAEERREQLRRIDGNTPAARLPGYKFVLDVREITSPLLSKYLPDYRIYAARGAYVMRHDGRLIGLPGRGGGPYLTAPDLESMAVSDFLREIGIKVQDKETAIELALLSGHIRGRVEGYDLTRWRYHVEKNDNTWIISVTYTVNDGASIMAPPHWEVVIDERGYVVEVARVHAGFPDLGFGIKIPEKRYR